MKAQITEIIGLTMTVIESSNKDLIGITGQIIDETKNTLSVNTKSGQKFIPKLSCKLEFYRNNKKSFVNGTHLVKRPHERLEIFL